jgi:transmembrane sensor
MMQRLWRSVRQRQAEAAARRWYARLHGGEATADDREQHRAWLDARRCNREAYASVANVDQRLSEAKSSFSASEIDRLLGDLKPAAAATSRGSRRLAVAGVALSIVVCAGLGYLLYASRYAVTLDTPIAQTIEQVLPDGSRLTLGGASRVLVRYGVFTRSVSLERGEAFFDVAHGRRAFAVHAAGTEVIVHGTKFEVRLDTAGLTRVSVADGTVAVGTADSRASAAVTLRRGQAVEVDDRGQVSTVQQFDPAQVGAWKHGQLVYRGAMLSTVTADFSRYSARQIVVNDPAIATLRVTGLFRTDNLDDALRSLESVLPVKVVAAASDVYIVLPATTP